jgi:hypothetical protein
MSDIDTIKAIHTVELEEEFVDGPDMIAGLQLYPYSAGRKIMLKRLNNELLHGKQLAEIQDLETAILEFLYIHTLDETTAIRSIKDADKWSDMVLSFSCKCSPSLDEEVALVVKILRKADKSKVEVVSKPSSGVSENQPDPPPNS